MADRKNFQNLTDAKVRDLEVTGKKYEVWDRNGTSSVSRLCVRVEASGLKTFYYVYSIGGQTEWFRIGSHEIGVRVARNEARVQMAVVARGGNPQAERRARRGG